MASALACQQVCTANPQCAGYTTVGPAAGTSGNVSCYLKSQAVASALKGNGVYTGAKGRCSSYAAQAPMSATSSCTDTLVASAMARLRSRRSQLTPSVCSKSNEVACGLKRSDGTLGTGFECVDVRFILQPTCAFADVSAQTQTEIEHCGTCFNSCSSQQGANVLYSGCSEGRCQACASLLIYLKHVAQSSAVSCKEGYMLDDTKSDCVENGA